MAECLEKTNNYAVLRNMHDNLIVLNRVLEIAEENRYISLDRGFIVIESKGKELGRIPLYDVAVLLLSAQSITLTKKYIQCNLSLYTIRNYIGCIITD